MALHTRVDGLLLGGRWAVRLLLGPRELLKVLARLVEHLLGLHGLVTVAVGRGLRQLHLRVLKPHALVLDRLIEPAHVVLLGLALDIREPVHQLLVLPLQHAQTNVLLFVRLADQVLLGAPTCPARGPDGLAVVGMIDVTVIGLPGLAYLAALREFNGIGELNGGGAILVFLDMHYFFSLVFFSHGHPLRRRL